MRPTVLSMYSDRFREALGCLCTEAPDPSMCMSWLFDDDEELQHWVCDHARIETAQGIGLIDAARTVADQPVEGCWEMIPFGLEQLLLTMMSESVYVGRTRRGTLKQRHPFHLLTTLVGGRQVRTPLGAVQQAAAKDAFDEILVEADGGVLSLAPTYSLPAGYVEAALRA